MKLRKQRVAVIARNCDLYHERYYKKCGFRGPSLHFHERVLFTDSPFLSTNHLELIYATLASWGMHRMGKRGAKMLPFADFRKSVASLRPQLLKAREITPSAATEKNWDLLGQIFRGIKVMETTTILVGNSKVMAHLLPRAVAPIDRQYTLRFLVGENPQMPKTEDGQWEWFRTIHSEFYYPLSKDRKIRARSDRWMSNRKQWFWDTSPLKIIDNLVIGARTK